MRDYILSKDDLDATLFALRDSLETIKSMRIVDCDDPLVMHGFMKTTERLITELEECLILEPTSIRLYHTLLRQDDDHLWCAEFGDYEMEVVQKELDDSISDASDPYLIISTDHDQKAIDAEIATQNSVLIQSREFDDDIPF